MISGTVEARRPPKKMAEMGTPVGSSHSGATVGHCAMGVQYREFGCAAGSVDSGVHCWPRQSIRCSGGVLVIPSHQTSPSSVSAVLVKIELPSSMVSMAFGLVLFPVPGATPKNPASGLTAYRRPSAPKRIQAMSSPIVSAVQPGSVGCSIAMLVLPHEDGNAAATYFTAPSGEVSLRISMCSASQPSSRAITDAIRRAKHFLPNKAFPPYPDP
ncbi:Uncharacterised protein [Mycobacteroides abscessus subsp. bolletii]|nr:Uncharacterised protein [Mycobacteroides abscessus subsp. bolletii]